MDYKQIIENYKIQIEELFGSVPSNKIMWKLKQYPELLEKINSICKLYSFFINPSLFIQVCLDRKRIFYCKICGSPIQVNKKNVTCSNECRKKYLNSNEVISLKSEKTKKTNLERYGVESVFQSDIVKDKIKNTVKERYGVEYITQSNIMKEKSRITCNENYGSNYYLGSSERKEKLKTFCLEHYGVENPSQSEEIKIKKKETYNLNFGSIEKKLELSNKRKETNKQLYNGFNSKEEYLKWIRIENLEDAILLSPKEEFFKDRYKKFKWKCKYCGNTFESKYNNGNLYSKCKCQKISNGYSIKEKELVDFCKIYFSNIKENNYSLIFPKELDIFIPSINLAIEFNGVRFHDVSIKGTLYHLNKTKLCENKGVRLIHIWEDEWNNNKEEIKKKLIDIFENKEIIDYSKVLERDWYPLKEIQGYKLEVLPPKIIIRDGYSCENTGYLKYTRNE